MSARRILVVHLTEWGAIPVAIEATLAAMQQLVGGQLLTVQVFGDFHLFVNEDGATNPFLKVWWVINGQPIYGPCFLARMGEVDGELDIIGLAQSEVLQLATLLSRTAAAATSVPWHVTFSLKPIGFGDDPKAN